MSARIKLTKYVIILTEGDIALYYEGDQLWSDDLDNARLFNNARAAEAALEFLSNDGREARGTLKCEPILVELYPIPKSNLL